MDAAGGGTGAGEALQNKFFKPLITDHKSPKVPGVDPLGKLRSKCVALAAAPATGTLPATTTR